MLWPRAGPRRPSGFVASQRLYDPSLLRLLRGSWELEILPERGGRVRSLRMDGAERRDRGTALADRTPAGFVEGGAQGWDELVPTVDAASWRGVELPDH